MEQLVIKTSLKGVRPVSANIAENIKRLDQIQKLFSNNGMFRIFCRPEINPNNEISWYTDLPGKITNISVYPKERQETIKQDFKNKVNELYRQAVAQTKRYTSKRELISGKNKVEIKEYETPVAETHELFDFLDNCFEIPSYNSIFIVENEKTTHYVLSFWGFIYDTHSSEKGLVAKLNPKTTQAIFITTLFYNGNIANSIDMSITLKGKTFLANTGDSGSYKLEEVPIFSFLKIILHKTQNKSDFLIKTDDRLEYFVYIELPAKDITIKLTDNSGNILPSTQILITFNGRSDIFTSDANGNFIIPEVTVGSEIVCSQNGQVIESFHCQANKDVYSVVGKTPYTNIKVNVTDENGNPSANCPIDVEIQGKRHTTTTDDNGVLILDKLPIKSYIKVSYTTEGIETGSRYLSTDTAEHTFVIQPKTTVNNEITKEEQTGKFGRFLRRYGWIFLLLLMTILGSLYYFVFYKNQETPTTVVEKTDTDLQGKSGNLRFNLQWNTPDDLDLYVIDPCGNAIYYGSKTSTCNDNLGELDVDANLTVIEVEPQENIYWEEPSSGKYEIKVKHYKQRTDTPKVPFKLTIVHLGKRMDFSTEVNSGELVDVTIYKVE